MSLFTEVLKIAGEVAIKSVIGYGNQCGDGSHDHRTNKGSDRTPAQKAGDAAKKGN